MIDFMYQTHFSYYSAFLINSLHFQVFQHKISGKYWEFRARKARKMQLKPLVLLLIICHDHEFPWQACHGPWHARHGTFQPWHGCARSWLALPWSCHDHGKAYLRFAKIMASLPRLRSLGKNTVKANIWAKFFIAIFTALYISFEEKTEWNCFAVVQNVTTNQQKRQRVVRVSQNATNHQSRCSP